MHLWLFCHSCLCTFSWVAAAAAQTPALLIAAFFCGGLYVCHRATLSSLSPRKNRNTPSSSCYPPPPHLSPPPLGFDPPLHPRWKDDRARKERAEREGERRKRDDSSSTSVVHRERESERGKDESAILMMSLSPWEKEETYAASRGVGAGLSMHMLTALSLHTCTGLTASV